MTKKDEAMKKAKESWRKIVEWGKELWKWTLKVIWWTTWALWYSLVSLWERGASIISQSREDDRWISSSEKARRKNATKEYIKRSKKHISKAWDLGKVAISWTWKILRWWWKILKHTAKAWYHLIDAWDKAIWEKIEKKQQEKWKRTIWKVTKLVRDNIVKILIASWLVGYGVYEWWKYISEKNKDGSELIINNDSLNSSETLMIWTWEYDRLKGKTITTRAPLTRWYLWWDLANTWNLVIEDTIVLNPSNSLHNLWTKKIKTYGQSTKDISELDKMDASSMTPDEIENFRFRYPIDATYLFVVKPYIDWKENRDIMTLQDFMNKSNKLVEGLKRDTESYDWGLTWDKKTLFDTIRKDITWECIVAYAMTELCENKQDWEFNKQLFDLLLRNSWVNYLADVPAIYDGKTSYWLYQFTEYALHDVPWDVRWASVVNKVLPSDKKIPGSVIDLKTWQDQTKAAYMFAIFNLNSAVKKLSDQQAKELLNYHKTHKKEFVDNMTQLIAMCHHFPVDAKTLKQWHEGNHRMDIYNYGKAKEYGKASKNNYEALLK